MVQLNNEEKFFPWIFICKVQADLRTKEDGEECEEFLAAEAQVLYTSPHPDISNPIHF